MSIYLIPEAFLQKCINVALAPCAPGTCIFAMSSVNVKIQGAVFNRVKTWNFLEINEFDFLNFFNPVNIIKYRGF